TFDIIFLDPPYRYGHIHKLLPFAAAKLRDGGCIICEFEKGSEELTAPEGMTLKKVYTYGKINVAVFRKPSEEDEL
ncbi:MAG: RsmD family RNA methyltransferase, partial [Ruminococcus sp.]|nr:RsmD family RNA methyltransferase [Ruminococcus sp.]